MTSPALSAFVFLTDNYGIWQEVTFNDQSNLTIALKELIFDFYWKLKAWMHLMWTSTGKQHFAVSLISDFCASSEIYFKQDLLQLKGDA